MGRTPREWVRTAVGIAAVAPALGLFVLAYIIFTTGGFGGFMAGLVVVAVAVGLLLVALLMTHAPVTIHKLLTRTEEKKAPEDQQAGRNGDR